MRKTQGGIFENYWIFQLPSNKICVSEESHLLNSGSTLGKLQKTKEMGSFR